MIKAIAIKTAKDGKTSILHVGLKGDCLKVAREEGAKIGKLGDACVQVFSGSIFNDDGRKADYQSRLAADQKAKADKPAAKKAAKKAAKVAS